ncbi:putative Dynein heavy chain 7-like 9 [Homarus americanus]|uniref:Putative Dynein heavy chain 7-like 9 n=1 Tax=Homarus americanus TaxID=6706 RepID=A0A8J5MLL6_HOMAM|nr:putative Dynein heavy chain 7-like 9 [Homarus americanus]
MIRGRKGGQRSVGGREEPTGPPTLPSLTGTGRHNPSDIARYTLQQLLVTTEILVPPMPRFVGRGSGRRLVGRRSPRLRTASTTHLKVTTHMEGGSGGGGIRQDSTMTPATMMEPAMVAAEFRNRMKPLTQPKKYGAVPAPAGDGSNPWDYSQLLHRRRARIRHAAHFHRRRRAEFALLVMNSCRRLRATHRPSPPDLVQTLIHRIPIILRTKYDRILKELFQELQGREVQPVQMQPLGTFERFSRM